MSSSRRSMDLRASPANYRAGSFRTIRPEGRCVNGDGALAALEGFDYGDSLENAYITYSYVTFLRYILRRKSPRGNAIPPPGFRPHASFNSDVQCGHRSALMAILEQQYGQSLVVGTAGAGAGCRFNRFTWRMSRKMAKATMRKSITVLRNSP